MAYPNLVYSLRGLNIHIRELTNAMTVEMLPGGIQMVKIDGARVRRLREQKGLTQLYVATAVQVTTDTISRWENKRYPSIK